MWTVPEHGEFLVLRKTVLSASLTKLQELPNLLWLFGGLQARV